MKNDARNSPKGPLSGVKVVDLTSVAMGPYATQLLGDMGADVVKIEPLEGDVFRHIAPARNAGMGAAFLNFNRNKRSVALDLKSEQGSSQLRELLACADVFVFNLRPESIQRLGLNYESLRRDNPRLVYCGAYGFSEQGPYAGRAAFDDIIQAMSGLASLHSFSTGEPTYVNTILADKVTGLHLAYAVSTALYERERSGLGQAIEVSMFETMTGFNMMEHLAGETFVPAQGDTGYDRLMSKHRRPYRTSNGHIALLPYTDAHWKLFFMLAGRQDLADDARYENLASRSKHIDTLYRELADTLCMQSTEYWLEILQESDIPHSKVQSLKDLLHDEHLESLNFFSETEHPSEGLVRNIGFPIRMTRTPASMREPAPQLGEHCAEQVLGEWKLVEQP